MSSPRSSQPWLTAALLVLSWFSSDRAVAQPMGKTVVVPFALSEELPSTLAKQVEAELQKRRVVLISLHDAHDRFLSRSRKPQRPAASDIDALAKEAQAAIEHVALGRTSAAERSVHRIIELAEHSLETLNRETATARGLLDACLALVRASLHDNKRDEALDQAMRCRRLVPDLAPSDVAHPANVVGALAEADDQLRRMRVGSLSVNALPERGCEVYLNGRHLGHSPFALDRAPAGDYRVQVECPGESQGRVHIVQLGDDPTKLTVDASFDRSIETEPRLALRYTNAEEARGALVGHAAALGREVRAEDVVLVGRLDGQLTLLRVQTNQTRLVAGAALAEVGPGHALARAAETLAQARFDALQPEDFRPREMPLVVAQVSAVRPSGAPPAGSPQTVASAGEKAAARAQPSAASAERPQSRVLTITGAVLTGVGSAALGTGFGLYVRSRGQRDDAQNAELGSPEQRKLQREYEDFRLVPLVGVAGSALLTAAVPMLLPKHGPRSAAGWVGGALAGVAGLAAIAFGAIEARKEPVLGGLLISAGAPLITIPLTQLVRASHR